MEEPIQDLEGFHRKRLKIKIDAQHQTIPWLMRHAAFIHNKFAVGSDGRTPYERIKGKSFKKELLEFGESVLFMKPMTLGRNKFEVRWDDGVWIGIRDESGEHLIGTPEGVIRVRTTRRKMNQIDGMRWNSTACEECRGNQFQDNQEQKLKREYWFPNRSPEMT